MPVLLALLVVGLALAGAVALWRRHVEVGAAQQDRSPTARAVQAWQTRREPGPRLLPPGHRPPPGLGPLSPSERFLAGETARGLRELQLFLIDHRAA